MGMAQPADPVVEQLRAYNARDAAAFAACYAPDVRVIDLLTGSARLEGHAAFARAYAEQFARWPDQRAQVVHRQIAGELVIDTEFVTGVPDRPDAHVVAIYHVCPTTHLIDRVWFSPRY
jgi:hypothetical protein